MELWTGEDLERVLDGVSSLGWLVLKRFSASYKPSDILAAFTCLSRSEFDLLRRLHFGLNSETRTMLAEHVPSFLRTTPSTTEHIIEERRGPPRGRIDWTRTYARRTQSGNDATRFVTRPIERTNDSAAARLVAFVLSRIVQNAEWVEKRQIPEFARVNIGADAMLARRGLAALRGRGVRVPTRLSGRDVAPLRRSRRPDVISAVRVFDLFVNVVELANENLLRSLLRQQQMAPEDHDDLFEIWTLLTFVGHHLRDGWQISEAVLIGGEAGPKRPKFTMQKDQRTAELFYQTVPTEMAKASAYKAIFADYDLDATLRRPDITAKVTSSDGDVQRLIIEVKRTKDQGYILDSVYKTMGYVADFESTIGPNAPLALLVVWSGISRKESDATDTPIRIASATEFEEMSLPY